MFEDGVPFPMVGYVSSLEGIRKNVVVQAKGLCLEKYCEQFFPQNNLVLNKAIPFCEGLVLC